MLRGVQGRGGGSGKVHKRHGVVNSMWGFIRGVAQIGEGAQGYTSGQYKHRSSGGRCVDGADLL